jgi:formylglycine-generating enzyme required for sulfatase activity
LTEARLQIELAEQYTLLLDLRAANNWRAVQGGLADIERQKPGYPDPQALMVWAAAAQRREEQYDAALEAVGQQQWTAAHTTLKALLAEQPDAAAIKLLARVESELRKIAEQERQRKIAEAAAQKQAEEERQRKIADAAAQKRAEEEQQRKAAEAAAQKRAEEERQRKAAAAAQKQAEKEQQRKAAAAAVPQPTSRSSTPNQPTNPTRSRLLIGLGLAALMLAVVASIVFSRRTPSPTALPTSVPAIENPTANATPVWTALPTSVPALENPTATDLSLLQVPGGAALTFVEVPGGAFLMGASDHDTNAQSDEKPQHTVTLPTYWIGKTEVTNAQYRPFVTGDGYSNPAYWTSAGWAWREKNNVVAPAYWHDSTLNGDDLPVGGMSWYEAMAYCRWLSSKTGEDIQLPTEAEWEKAARGTDGRIYPWGDTWNQTYAQSTSGGSVPIGSYPAGASPYGALDMAGNVWEWTRSEYRSYPYNPIDGREDATNPDGKRFTLRGGGWSIESIDLRASGRYYYFTPDFHDRNVGFRLARHRK